MKYKYSLYIFYSSSLTFFSCQSLRCLSKARNAFCVWLQPMLKMPPSQNLQASLDSSSVKKSVGWMETINHGWSREKRLEHAMRARWTNLGVCVGGRLSDSFPEERCVGVRSWERGKGHIVIHAEEMGANVQTFSHGAASLRLHLLHDACFHRFI